MKFKCLIAFLLVSVQSFSQLKIDKNRFINLLNQGRYNDVYKEADKLRKTEFGKCLMVDYFIARALCGGGHPDLALKKYDFILKNYKLQDKDRAFFADEINRCKGGLPSNARASQANGEIRDEFSYIMAMQLPEASVGGKTGRVYDCTLPADEFSSVKPIEASELDSRLFSLDQGTLALSKYRKMLPSNYQVALSGRFVVITCGNTTMDNIQLRATAETLEKTYNFYISQYGIRPPNKLLTVYLLPNVEALRQTALLVHGIRLPQSNIGYSFNSDLSLVGIADNQHLGTLSHELFHLMVRTDVGDIPAWLDEGMACIYESCHWEGNTLRGDVKNWRTSVLKDVINERRFDMPRLLDFINATRAGFDGLESKSSCIAAINYAYGKHFMLYLQETGRMGDVLNAFKNRDGGLELPLLDIRSDVEILEMVIGRKIEAIEKDFDAWFTKTYSFSLYESSAYKTEPSFYSQWNSALIRLDMLRTSPAANKNSNLADIETSLLQLKKKYDQLPITPQKNLQYQQIQQVAYDEDREIFEKEKRMEGLDVLKAELRDLAGKLSELDKAGKPGFIVQQKQSNPDLSSLPSPDKVLGGCTLHVKKDPADKSGNLTAHNYYLVGVGDNLSYIKEVFYQRNHNSFPEFQKSFYSSRDRSNGFVFKSYQWGRISTAYVYIVLMDGRTATPVLMNIVYDN